VVWGKKSLNGPYLSHLIIAKNFFTRIKMKHLGRSCTSVRPLVLPRDYVDTISGFYASYKLTFSVSLNPH